MNATRLREIQIYAPHLGRDLNNRLSVLSEVAYHLLRRARPAARILKLVVRIAPDAPSIPGDQLIHWPGKISEFRVVDGLIHDGVDDQILRGRVSVHVAQAVDAVRDTFSSGPPASLIGQFEAELSRAAPYEFELVDLAIRDPVTGQQFRVFHRFGPDFSEVVWRADGLQPIESNLAAIDSFLDLGALFTATQARIVNGAVVYYRGREQIATVPVPGV
jgi:hypothetical protein